MLSVSLNKTFFSFLKISNLLICFCSFHLSCPILEQDIFIENVYIVLYCLILLNSVLFAKEQPHIYVCVCVRVRKYVCATFVTLVADHWLEREIAQWVHHEGSI